MATKTTSADRPGYSSVSFPGSDRNVYADYLRAVFVRKLLREYIILILLSGFVAATYINILINMDYYGSDEFIYGNMHSHINIANRLLRRIAVPAAFVGAPLTSIIFLWALPALSRRTLAFGNYAWPRLCVRFFGSRPVHPYFASLERHPMRADVGESSVRVYREDGAVEDFDYRCIERAFRKYGLVVLETGPDKLPTGEVILDVTELPKDERRGFLAYLDSRLPDSCKCFYRRRSGCLRTAGHAGEPAEGGTA